jgi:uncharacterized membrane protein YphA (DoxX/SURF4 family)
MTPKTTRVLYWIFTLLLALMLFADGIGGVTKQQAGQDVLRHLGYPMYLLIIAGIAKLLAVIALVQPRYRTIKEWAFAGIAITFIGAFASRAFVGDSGFELIFPLIMLAFMFVPYGLWKRLPQRLAA